MNQEFSLNYRNELQFRNYIVGNFLDIDFWTPLPLHPLAFPSRGARPLACPIRSARPPKTVLAAALSPEIFLT